MASEGDVPDEFLANMGWTDDPEAVQAVAEAQPFDGFGSTPAAAMTDFDSIPEEVLGWRLYKLATGKDWPIVNQGAYGSCVSFGTANAILLTSAAEILAGDQEEVRMPCQEVIYGGSRVQVGHGRLRGQGSIGAWAADFVKNWGVLPRGVYGSHDLTTYNISTCDKFGHAGIPEDLQREAKKNPMGEITQVRTFKEACLAIANGFGISVCSGQGFNTRRQDDGFAAPKGSWQHCMCFMSYRKSGKRPGLFCVNSWGASTHTGGKSSPDMPVSGFWVDAEVAERMLRANDSWAFSKFKGFESKNLNLFF